MERKPFLSLDRAAFMRRHWQREPLLVRRAFASFRDPLSPREVLAAARAPHSSARLVRRRGASWSLEHGPFTPSKMKQLPRRGWTVLVQDTNHFCARAASLLAAFDFIPHARIDDVMVSYAVPGGGVGPHVDSYDVFLVQGRGRRRWQISRQDDRAFVPGLDLRILERFRPEREFILEAGDMLYLPPGVAHDGVAQTECLTWSIGFRAPPDDEIAAAFLDFLRDRPWPEGRYGDAGAKPARHAGEIPAQLLAHIARTVERIAWTPRDVRAFAGALLSEPKPHVFFAPPRRPLAFGAFRARARRGGLALDAKARLLFSGTMFFLNGDRIDAEPAARGPLRRLADGRKLDGPLEASADFWRIAYEAYLRGSLAPG